MGFVRLFKLEVFMITLSQLVISVSTCVKFLLNFSNCSLSVTIVLLKLAFKKGFWGGVVLFVFVFETESHSSPLWPEMYYSLRWLGTHNSPSVSTFQVLKL